MCVIQVLASKGREGKGCYEFSRPSGLCCDDSGNIIVADSKNQRIMVYTANLKWLWDVSVALQLSNCIPNLLFKWNVAFYIPCN